MENKEIARLLSETADLMEIAGEDGFRIRSYRNAASAIESHPERVVDIVRATEGKITGIPGVGKGIAFALVEIVQRGSFDRRDEMLEKYPASALELLKIQGLGPKGIALLYQHYAVRNVDDLETHLPRTKAAIASADGREARGESAAFHRSVPEKRGAISD